MQRVNDNAKETNLDQHFMIKDPDKDQVQSIQILQASMKPLTKLMQSANVKMCV
jgi:hypothetical protein